jgi:hypothetical protein
MLLKDDGSQYIENIKFRDSWFMIKSRGKRNNFFKEEVRFYNIFKYIV